MQDPLAGLVHLDFQDLLALQDSRELRASLAAQELQACPEDPGLKAPLGHLVFRGRRDLLGLLALQVRRETQGRAASPDPLVDRASLVPWVPLVFLDRQDSLEDPEALEQMDSQVRLCV